MEATICSVPTDIAALRPGDHVVVISPPGNICFRGEVDDVAPHLKLVWIRDDRRGERKIFIGEQDDVRLALPDKSAVQSHSMEDTRG